MTTRFQKLSHACRQLFLQPQQPLQATSYKLSANRGFTLLELIISMGLLVVIVVLVMGIYGNFSATQRRDISEQKLLEDLRFGIEVFNREARTGYGSTFATTDSSGESVIFRNQSGLCVQYRLSTAGRLERGEGESATECNPSNIASSSFVPVTGPDIEITNLLFVASPAEEKDGELFTQGYITFVVEAQTNNQSVAPVSAQSTVTSRQVIPY